MTYKLLLIFGTLIGYFVALSLSGKDKLDKFLVGFSLFLFSLIIAFLAKLFGFVFFGGSWKSLFTISGETTIFGPIFFVLLLSYLTTFRQNYLLIKLLPILIIFLLTIQSLGKLGCHFAGCCYGIPGKNFFCFVTPTNISKYYQTEFKLFPIQILESLFLFLFLILIIYIFIKFPFKRHLIPFLYLIYYSLHRFFAEFLRSDYLPKFLFLKIGQLLAILVFVLTLLNFLLFKKKTSKTNT